jgi:tetratricopeptide (TPR) repeat protein
VRAVSGPGRGDREASDALVARAKDADGERALRLLREALEACPGNPDAAVALTVQLLDRGELEAAHRWARHATELRPRRAAYQVLLGDVREAQGRSRRARKAYERALELDPDHQLARRRLDRP